MRTMALVKRIIREMVRDKRTLALLFVAPLFILSLMYVLFNGDTVEPKIGIVDGEERLIDSLEAADFEVISYQKGNDETVVDDDLDAMLQLDGEQYELILQNNDPSVAKSILMKVNQVIAAESQAKFVGKTGAPLSLPKLEATYVYGDEDTDFFDVLSPILVGFFTFFFVFLISGIGFLKERTSGTLERLMATPLKRGEIVAAYLIGFGLFAVIQTLIIVLFSVNILDVVLVGSIWNVIVINLILALVALSLGTLLSSFAGSEFQMMQFIPLVIVPQFFFSGILPLEGMAGWLQAIAKTMPIYYASNALRDIMYKGLDIGSISGELLILTGFAAIFIFLNILALKRYRTL